MIRTELSSQIRAKKPLIRPAVIRLHDVDEAAAARLRTEFGAAVAAGQPIIPLVIDSGGGDQYALLSILDTIAGAKRRAMVITVADGKAMSAGAEILAAGTRDCRFVAPLATVMVHDAANINGEGKVAEVAASAGELARVNRLCYDLLDRHCRKRSGYFEKRALERGRADWYLTPADCLEHGLADHIGLPDIVVSIGVNWRLELPRPGPKKATRRQRSKRR